MCVLSDYPPFSPVSSLTPSSGMSEDLDHQETQLALQDAKMAARNKIRSRFHSSSDLIHRLFVCISGKSGPFVCHSPSITLSLLVLISVTSSGAMKVLQISCRPTMQVTCAASSRLCLKSWQQNVSRVTMINKRKVRACLGCIYVDVFSISCLRNNILVNSADNTNNQSLYTGLTFFFCGIQQVLFCLVQRWRTVSSVRRPFPHPRWQPRPVRASSKVRKILAEYIPDSRLFRFLCSRCPDDF